MNANHLAGHGGAPAAKAYTSLGELFNAVRLAAFRMTLVALSRPAATSEKDSLVEVLARQRSRHGTGVMGCLQTIASDHARDPPPVECVLMLRRGF